LDKAKLHRLRTLAERFQHPSTDKKFREWADEMTAADSSEPVKAGFDFHRLPHRYDIF
jgi:hypothetical protein